MDTRRTQPRVRARIATLVALAALLVATPALAGSLADARAAGQVGERLDGYVGIVVSNPSAELRKLVDDINARRKAEYRAIAARNGTSVGPVGKLAAKQLIEKAPRGHYYQDASGSWRKK